MVLVSCHVVWYQPNSDLIKLGNFLSSLICGRIFVQFTSETFELKVLFFF